MITLADIFESIAKVRPEQQTPSFSGAVIDSRQAVSGNMFIAIPGENVDGHEYIEDAFKRGASFALE